jgi:hypothetical protein
VSRRFACVELWRIPLPGTGVKIVSAVALFHSFGVARQGPWITWVNKDGQELGVRSTTATTAAKAKR